jgi:hypothetical protein
MTFLMPGWYDLESDFSVFSEADEEVEKRMVGALRYRNDCKQVST